MSLLPFAEFLDEAKKSSTYRMGAKEKRRRPPNLPMRAAAAYERASLTESKARWEDKYKAARSAAALAHQHTKEAQQTHEAGGVANAQWRTATASHVRAALAHREAADAARTKKVKSSHTAEAEHHERVAKNINTNFNNR